MRRTMLLVLVALPALLRAQESLRGPAVVLHHLAVVDVDGASIRRDSAVMMRGGRIAAARRTDAIDVPPGAEVIDRTGIHSRERRRLQGG